jgi:aldehyde:ferredoxin oxidoreductase
VSTVVCPLCVQHRCVTCKRDFNDSEHFYQECFDTEYEPYWPDGSVAVITQQEWCDRCAQAVADMEADRDST